MPTKGVPSTRPLANPNPEAYSKISKIGLDRALTGVIYNQYGNTASIATTTTAASIFNESATTSHGTRTLPADYWAWFPRYYDQATSLAGGALRGKAWGTIKNNTSTPNITVTIGVWVAGTYRAVASTGALAMISTAAAAVGFEFDFWMQSRTLGAAATASLIGGGRFTYYVTNLTQNNLALPATIEITNIVTTGETIFDSQFTWGTSHGNNELIVQGAFIEAIG